MERHGECVCVWKGTEDRGEGTNTHCFHVGDWSSNRSATTATLKSTSTWVLIDGGVWRFNTGVLGGSSGRRPAGAERCPFIQVRTHPSKISCGCWRWHYFHPELLGTAWRGIQTENFTQFYTLRLFCQTLCDEEEGKNATSVDLFDLQNTQVHSANHWFFPLLFSFAISGHRNKSCHAQPQTCA